MINIIKELFKVQADVDSIKLRLINKDTIIKLNTVLNYQFFQALAPTVKRKELVLIINHLDSFDKMFNKIEYVNKCFVKLLRFTLNHDLQQFGARRIDDAKPHITNVELINMLLTKLHRSFWNHPIDTFTPFLI